MRILYAAAAVRYEKLEFSSQTRISDGNELVSVESSGKDQGSSTIKKFPTSRLNIFHMLTKLPGDNKVYSPDV